MKGGQMKDRSQLSLLAGLQGVHGRVLSNRLGEMDMDVWTKPGMLVWRKKPGLLDQTELLEASKLCVVTLSSKQYNRQIVGLASTLSHSQRQPLRTPSSMSSGQCTV